MFSNAKAAATVLVVTLVLTSACLSCRKTKPAGQIGMAVEFMNHAAAAYVAEEKGWYEQHDLPLSTYESYVTGMALASALARGDIQVAYICLVPAINAYANAGVPIRVVAGTHKYGYALVANPKVITRPGDLAKEGVRIGCVREGGAVDVLLNRTLERHGLDLKRILPAVQRMNPPKQLVAIKSGQLDAAFLPEQWATMAENLGFEMLLTARDVWPGMQGSVLVVKQELIDERPDFVRKLVAVTRTATVWINGHADETARILALRLSLTGGVIPAEAADLAATLEIAPTTMLRSMNRMEYTTDLSLDGVQEVIDYAANLGYIRGSFPAANLVDARFLQ